MSFTAIRMGVGRVVLVAGILILAFIPYLLWGTGLMTARSQDQLRNEFQAAQQRTGSVPKEVPAPQTSDPSTPPELAPTVPAPPIGSPVGDIAIPKIGLSMVVVEGTGTAQLEQGPGHYPGTPLPGQAGNVAIAGHRTTYLHPFYNLNDLTAGDSITLTTLQGFFRYQVLSSQSVSPSDVGVVAPTSTPQLTLTTCNPPYSASQRLVVHAKLVASYLVHKGAAGAGGTQAKAGAAESHLQAVSGAEPRSWPTAIAWGIAVAVLTTALWMLVARSRRWRRAALATGGAVAWVIVVFLFFQALAPLLPASY